MKADNGLLALHGIDGQLGASCWDNADESPCLAKTGLCSRASKQRLVARRAPRCVRNITAIRGHTAFRCALTMKRNRLAGGRIHVFEHLDPAGVAKPGPRAKLPIAGDRVWRFEYRVGAARTRDTAMTFRVALARIVRLDTSPGIVPSRLTNVGWQTVFTASCSTSLSDPSKVDQDSHANNGGRTSVFPTCA